MEASATVAKGFLSYGFESYEADHLRLVQPCKEASCHSCTTPSDHGLATATMSSIRNEFQRRGHHPSNLQYEGLADLVSTLVGMAEGVCQRQLYLSSLDPGVGKTTAFTHFIAQLIGSDHYDDVAVLVCVAFKSEIEALIKAMAQLDVPSSEIGVLTSDQELNGKGVADRDKARVLVTTHAMLKRRCFDRRFADVRELQYMGKPRQVRIWDEALLPGDVVTLNVDQIAGLLEPCRHALPNLADGLEVLRADLASLPDRSSFTMPSLKAIGGAQAEHELRQLSKGHQDRVAINAEQLRYMAGRTVCIRHSQYGVPSALDYRDTLPDDLGPMVILDASGRVRETYRLWEKERGGGLVRLKEAAKDYRNLEVNLWPVGGSKGSFLRRGEDLMRGIAALVNLRPKETWLIIHHKDALSGTFPDQLRGLVNTPDSNLHFIHWGKHHGVNDYANIPNIILAGTLFLPEMIYEGRTRLAANLPTTPKLPKDMLTSVTHGEYADLILQGVSRAAVRKSQGGGCAPCKAYIIASKRSGIGRLLPRIFPDCKVRRWQPIPKKLTGKMGEVVAHVEDFFEKAPDGELPFKGLQETLAIPNKANFNKTIRKHPEFMLALKDLGVEEVTTGASRHCNALHKPQSSFPSDDDQDGEEPG